MLQISQLKKIIIAILLGLFFVVSQAQSATITVIDDNWVNWPGYTSTRGDEHGSPHIDKLRITVSDDNTLQKVELLWRTEDATHTRIQFDSLFINSHDQMTTSNNWDDWDFLIHDGGDQHTWTSGSVSDVVDGNVPGDGLWSVNANYQYTTAKVGAGLRDGNPNGIDAGFLENQQDFSSHITWNSTDGILTYDLSSFGIVSESGFFIAYSPYCANDVIGGSTSPVPVPAAVWLFASGLIGFIGFGKSKKQVST